MMVAAAERKGKAKAKVFRVEGPTVPAHWISRTITSSGTALAGVAFSTFRHNRHSLCGEDRQGAVADQRAYVLLLDQLDYTPHLRAGTVPAARRFLPQCLGLLQQARHAVQYPSEPCRLYHK